MKQVEAAIEEVKVFKQKDGIQDGKLKLFESQIEKLLEEKQMIKIENINEQMVQEMIAKAVRSSENNVTEQFKVLIS